MTRNRPSPGRRSQNRDGMHRSRMLGRPTSQLQYTGSVDFEPNPENLKLGYTILDAPALPWERGRLVTAPVGVSPTGSCH